MVPGTHETMMTSPHVKTLADTLAQYLRTEAYAILHNKAKD